MDEGLYNILFICTGNSARSIMAEVIMNHLGGTRFRAYSAGSQPRGEIHPMTLSVLAARQYDLSGLRSKSWTEFAEANAPPRLHRHRYFGVLAPNSPLRDAVTAMAAAPAQPASAARAQPVATRDIAQCPAKPGLAGAAAASATEPPPPSKRAAHYLWAVLIARIYEVLPLVCPICGGQMRIIAFITHSVDIRQILDHIGVESVPPHIAPARGPPLWDECDAQSGEGSQIGPDWDLVPQPAPDYEVDQRITW